MTKHRFYLSVCIGVTALIFGGSSPSAIAAPPVARGHSSTSSGAAALRQAPSSSSSKAQLKRIPTQASSSKRGGILVQLKALGKKGLTAKTLLNKLREVHPYSADHSRRVGFYAKAIALELGFSKLRAAGIERHGVLHDMGKLLTPTAVLDKPGKLNDAEFARIQKHSGSGHVILKSLLKSKHPLNTLAAKVAKFHHERPDGSGYPTKGRWEDIPMEAKIVAVADVYDAMTSQRSYNVPKTKAEALKVLKAIAGKQLDAKVVEAFVRAATRLPEPSQATDHAYGVHRLRDSSTVQ